MRIAYIYDAVYPWIKGGVERRIYELSKRLISRGHEVHWYCVKWWGDEDVIEHEGIILHGVCKRRNLYRDDRRSIGEAFSFASGVLLSLKSDFDVIDCQAFPFLSCFPSKMFAVAKEKPLVITWHEVWNRYWLEYLGRIGFMGRGIERATSRLTSSNISVSERTSSQMKAIGVKDKIEIIPNGIDFHGIGCTIPHNEIADIIYTGRLVKNKNVDLLVNAVNLIKRHNPDITCTIIGDGPERRSLEKLTSDLHLTKNIKYAGFLENHEKVISHMKSARVFALPSTREGFGIAALEANACGLPVVTVRHERNAVCDMISDMNGFVCDVSADGLARKILHALNVGEGLSDSCREKARGYDWEIITDQTESYYDRIAN